MKDTKEQHLRDAVEFAASCGFDREGTVSQNLKAMVSRIRDEVRQEEREICARICEKVTKDLFQVSKQRPDDKSAEDRCMGAAGCAPAIRRRAYNEHMEKVVQKQDFWKECGASLKIEQGRMQHSVLKCELDKNHVDEWHSSGDTNWVEDRVNGACTPVQATSGCVAYIMAGLGNITNGQRPPSDWMTYISNACDALLDGAWRNHIDAGNPANWKKVDFENPITNLDPLDVLEELVAESFGVEEGCIPGKTAAQSLLAIRALWRLVKAVEALGEQSGWDTHDPAQIAVEEALQTLKSVIKTT